MKAIIFDFDGTIIDTEQSEISAWQHVYTQHNFDLPMELWNKRIGTTPDNFDPFSHLQSLVSTPLDREEILRRRSEKYLELVAVLKPLPGVLDWIQAAHALKIRMSIATASRKVQVMGFLKQLGFENYFEFVVTRDDVSDIKPHPEVYLTALKKMQLNADEVIAIEDSPNGATAALGAGLRCLIVPSSSTLEMEFPLGFMTLNSLEELSLRDFLEVVERKNVR
jgi:HAD superfamily hydrolase (TIGR01509 family)